MKALQDVVLHRDPGATTANPMIRMTAMNVTTGLRSEPSFPIDGSEPSIGRLSRNLTISITTHLSGVNLV